MVRRPLIACPHCARLHERVPLPERALASCVRCGHVLYRSRFLSLGGCLALTLAALMVFAIANILPIARLSLSGMHISATLPQALLITWKQGHPAVALMTGLFGLGVPLAQLFFLLWALLAIASQRLPADFRYGMRMLRVLSPWSMVPVLMLGILVAIVKLSSLAKLQPDYGLWAFAVLTLLLTALGRVTALRLWRYAEDAGLVALSGSPLDTQHTVGACLSCGNVQNIASTAGPHACLRCGAAIHFRKPRSSSRTWALIIAAGILYFPANILPVMTIRAPTGSTDHTILGGVMQLWQMGSWDLAVIVFIASIVVPMTKLFALVVLLLRRRWEGADIQRQRTRLYELIEFIGQWSMLDVFVVVLLSAMADFPGLTQVTAGPGAGNFGLVVVLTMFAAMSYDPRCGWDARPAIERAGAGGRLPLRGEPAASHAVKPAV